MFDIENTTRTTAQPPETFKMVKMKLIFLSYFQDTLAGIGLFFRPIKTL